MARGKQVKRQAEAEKFAHMLFREEACRSVGIPYVRYPVPIDKFCAGVGEERKVAVEDLLLGLMQWLDVTDELDPPLAIARQILDTHYPADGKQQGSCVLEDENGVRSSFYIEPIRMDEPLVAWQREDHIFAFAQPSHTVPGRAAIGAPGVFSESVARSILGHAMTSFMQEPYDSYVGLQHSVGRTAAYYARDAGRTALMPWDSGLETPIGLLSPGKIDWLAPNQVAILVGLANGYC
ncbi:MAG: hypothetical protein AB7E24_04230 [Novosphingobium sp.]